MVRPQRPHYERPSSDSTAYGEASVGLDDVQAIAELAKLQLPGGRPVAVAQVLSSWLPPLRDLAAAMSSPRHIDVAPLTVFTHPYMGEDTP